MRDSDEEEQDKEELVKAKKDKETTKGIGKETTPKPSTSFFACCGPRDNAIESDGGESDQDEQSQKSEDESDDDTANRNE